MYTRLLNPPPAKSFFLFGPRGTGKSSWLRATFPQAVYLDLLEAELYLPLNANPQRLSSFLPAAPPPWVILDEVQKIPELLDEVHRLIETRKLRFILTGSSARKLNRKSANLLAGRALTLHMHPLTALELGKDFRLEHSLQFGQLPLAYVDPDPKAFLQSYVKTYLKEEIQQEGLTRNLSAFSRFLEAASFSQGSVLNVSAVSRECSVERKTIEQYFIILEDLLLACRVPPFLKRAKRRMMQHSKFYFFDTGVYRTIRPKGPLDSPADMDGPSLETLFLQELRAWNDYFGWNFDIFYWRTATGLEVDLILYGERGLWAFEVKRQDKLRPESLQGLKAFLKDYPEAKACLLYLGDRPMKEDKIQILPFTSALTELPKMISSDSTA